MNKEEHVISAVRPINSKTEDWLGRLPFAENLGNAILGWQEQDSLVIAIYGGWGSGKSSMKNLCLEYIRTQKNPLGPQILEFNPWYFTNQDHLFQSFFRELEIKCNDFQSEPERETFSKDIKSYAALLKASTPLVPLIPILCALIPGIDPVYLQALASGAVVGKGVLDSGHALMEQSANESEKQNSKETELKQKPLTIEELKGELVNQLSQRKSKVLVVIDDIDRLDPGSIQLVFQLIKAVADFPNVIYLLCFEREIVAKALYSPAYRGKDYLEKIVQVGFDLPTVSPTTLHRVLKSKIESLITALPKHNWNVKRWEMVFENFKDGFKTPRQMYRYLNSLSFHLKVFSAQNALEVDAIDLLLLEALRVFEPARYKNLYESKSRIFDMRIEFALHKNDQRIRNELKDFFDDRFDLNSLKQDWFSIVILSLFPSLASLYGVSSLATNDDEALGSDLRVCHEQSFDRYFLLSVPDTDLSQQQIIDLISLLPQKALFENELKAFEKGGLLNAAINRLDSNRSLISENHGATYVAALLDATEALGKHDIAISAILRFLLQFPEPAREKIVVAACNASNALGTFVLLARRLTFNAGRNNDPIVRSAAARKLATLAAKRLDNAARNGRLIKHPLFIAITFAWEHWKSKKPVQRCIANILRSPKGFWQILEFLVGREVQSETANNHHNEVAARFLFSTDYEWISKWLLNFTDYDEFKNRVEKLSSSKSLSKRQKALLSLIKLVFEHVLQRRNALS